VNTTTEISDKIRPLNSSELDTVSGGAAMHARFVFGCMSYEIFATQCDYKIVRYGWGECR
jgi:hypothetical protein